MSSTSSLPVGIWWNQPSAIAAYAVMWTAYHQRRSSRRRTITIDVPTTATNRAVPIVATIIPG